MRRSVRRALALVAAFIAVAFLVLLVNQTAQLVELAARVHPVLGDATLWGLVFLYAQVAGTAFLAGELEDLDLTEQIEPIISSAVGSAVGAVPGLQAASALHQQRRDRRGRRRPRRRLVGGGRLQAEAGRRGGGRGGRPPEGMKERGCRRQSRGGRGG